MSETFKIGDLVTKTKGANWTGRVVGQYSTDLTPEGYAVESLTERGSVQIYPVAALAAAPVEAQPVASTWTEAAIRKLSEEIAAKVATNASVAPQLCFPHIYLGLKDALAAPSAQPAGAASTAAVRDAALREAAEIARCWELGTPDGHGIADAIVSLKSQPADQQAAGTIDLSAAILAILPNTFGLYPGAVAGYKAGHRAAREAAASLVASVAQPVPDAYCALTSEGKVAFAHSFPSTGATTPLYLAASVAQPVPADAEIPPLPQQITFVMPHHAYYAINDMRERDAMWSARVRAALASHSAVPVAADRAKQLEHVILATSDDLAKLHAAFGFPEDQIIDTDDMVAAVERLTAVPVSQGEPVAWVKFLDDSIVIDEYCITTGGPCDTYENEEWRPVYTAPVAPKEAQPSQAVPAGWKLVPLDPTVEMMDGAFENISMSEAHTTYGVTQHVWDYMLAAAPVCQAVVPEHAGWVSVDELLPEVGQTVLTFAPPHDFDGPDDVRISFDCIDPNDDDHASWLSHNEHYEHYCCVAKPEGSTGPSEKAPYTHWMPLPAAPTPGAAK